MSSEKAGEVGIGIIGGAVVLTVGAVAGAAYLAGKGICATAKGTATIVGDARRGRRMRNGQLGAGAVANKTQEELHLKRKTREENYDRQIQGLKKEQQQMLKTFSEKTQNEREQYRAKLNELREVQKHYIDQRCNNLEQNLQHVEKNFESRMDDMVDQVNRQFSDERKRVDEAFQQERKAVLGAMESQRTHLQSQIDTFQQHFTNSRETATHWLEILENETSFIRNNYRHGFFCPGELERIEERLDLARTNLNNGIYEVSLSQEAFVQAQTLKNRLEYLDQEWETNRSMAVDLFTTAIGAYEEYGKFKMSQIEILSENENESPIHDESTFEVNTDEWTEGLWQNERTALQDHINQIKRPQTDVTLSELQTLQQEADKSISRAPVLAVKAKCAVIASALRSDMQVRFSEKLSHAGYRIEGNEWEQDDWKKTNHLVLNGSSGDKIAIAISPESHGEETINRINLAFESPDCNEEERKVRLKAISEAMNEAYGFQPGNQIDFQLKEGAQWNRNAPADKFDLAKLKQGSQ